MRIAVSACFVVAGLIVGGIGSAIALAEPEPSSGDAQDRQSSESSGDVKDPQDPATKDPEDPATKREDPATKPEDPATKDPEDPATKREDPATPPTEEPPTPPTEEPPTPPTEDPPTPPTEEPPTEEPCPGLPRCPDPRGDRPESGGGGGDGGIVPPPRGRPELPPEMQLPPPREVAPGEPLQPAVVAPVPVGVGAAAAVPLVPITLPEVVLPSVGLSGGVAPPAAPPGVPPMPLAPGAVTAEPPAGLEPVPAKAGSDDVVSASYRVGYAEYLRTAGMSQLAALALPGVAGMLVMTGAGGVIGYRQAKAGHAVRTGVAARFMN